MSGCRTIKQEHQNKPLFWQVAKGKSNNRKKRPAASRPQGLENYFNGILF
jgi:hypothetical protein